MAQPAGTIAARLHAPSRASLPIIAASMFLGLLSALATAFVVAQMRQTYLTPDDVERSLGLPVLLVVPLRGGARAARAARRSWK